MAAAAVGVQLADHGDGAVVRSAQLQRARVGGKAAAVGFRPVKQAQAGLESVWGVVDVLQTCAVPGAGVVIRAPRRLTA
jgi:hypothetical protein